MKWCLFLVSIICLSGCQQGNMYQISAKERTADEIMGKVALQLQKEKGLRPCGTGGQMMKEIKMLALSFDYYKPVDIQEARDLLVSSVDAFVTAVNADECIRPYLYNYPFEPKNIEIRIFIHNPDGSEVAPDKLLVITATDAVLKYKIDNPKTPLFKTIYKETYEEALQKMKANSSVTAKEPFTSVTLLKNPCRNTQSCYRSGYSSRNSRT